MSRAGQCLLGILAVMSALVGDAGGQERGGSGRRVSQPGKVSRVQWSEDGRYVEYTTEGQRYRFDLQTLEREAFTPEKPDGDSEAETGRSNRRPGRRTGGSAGLTGRYVGRPARGRQYTQVNSPDGQWEAHYRDWNVVLVPAGEEKGEPVQVTTDGNEHVHYGTASWVYGEELNQTRAMWWTPDSSKLLFYKFDDSKVRPFYLLRGWSEIGTELYPEFYPKAGEINPVAELMVYDLETESTRSIDIGGDPDEYIYGLRASPNGDVIMLNWTDRLQQHLKVLAVDPDSGQCRAIVEERQDTWQKNSPNMRFLKDGKRFLWPTERTGFTHYELRDLDGKLHHPVTQGEYPTGSITVVDEDSGWVGFTAYSSPVNPYYLQYHMVRLDGSGQRRVTTTDLHHSNFQLSPDRKWLVAQYETVNTPPNTALYTTEGGLVAKLAESDPASAANLAEMFQFRSSDDRFDIYGVLYKPADFDPERKYAAINSLYGGPGSNEFTPSYVSRPRSECGRGYLVVKVNNRGGGRRGKAFLGAAYLRLGDVDIQDHADAVRLLRERPYFDGERVGIVGHSYGGYMAAMGIVAHPDVYAASVVRAGVTDWRNYDTIYTERYMSTPQLNQKGYEVGAAATHVERLEGSMLILHGMMDDNVHPNNAFQLIAALDEAGKSYESRFWPNGAHGLGRGSGTTQNGFFDRILRPEQH